MFDLLLKNGTIIDGTGAPRYRADVALRGARVAAVERDGIRTAAARVIDVRGLCVTPGFVDMHSHNDLGLLAGPAGDYKIRQGIVTEYLGQDGISVAPVRPSHRRHAARQLGGLLGSFPEWTWSDVDDYLACLDAAHPATNVVYAVPHGTLRSFVMGHGSKPATKAQRVSMQTALHSALDQGAVGMTTGLIYAPCTYANEKEIEALCEVLAGRDSLLSVHLRSEGAGVLEALEEVLAIGTRTGCAINISHMKIAGAENFDKLARFLAILDRYRGYIPVSFDQYPYDAGSTTLTAALPPWVHDGGAEEILARLREPEAREQMRKQILDRNDTSWEAYLWLSGPEGMVVSSVASVDGQRWLGKSIAEIAEQRGCDAAEAIIDLLFEERLSVSVVSHNQSEVLVQSFMELDFGMFCTDGILGEQPHPRLFGSAARMLGHYVRDRQVMTLEQAVRRMSAMAYDKLGIPGEGCIAVGRGAHLVCFDPAVVLDGGSYDDPVRDPSGIRHVVVGGVLTMVDGELTGQRGGRVLRGR